MAKRISCLIAIVFLFTIAETIASGDPVIEKVAAGEGGEFFPGYGPAWSAVNGRGLDETGLLHSTENEHMWAGSVGEVLAPRGGCVDGENWIEMEFEHVYKLDQMWIWNYNEYYAGYECHEAGLKNVTIQYSATGGTESSDWQTLANGGSSIWQIPMATGLDNHPHDIEIACGGIEAKYVVITPNDGIGDGWWGPYDWNLGLSEVRFFGIASKALKPLPANKKRGVLPNTIVQWQAGSGAVSHDVYFGTDQTEVTNATRASHSNVTLSEAQADVNYSPALSLGQQYYWRVDEVNGSNDPEWRGDVWNFRVIPLTVYDRGPADGEAGREQLWWSGGYYASLHEVYFGTSFNDVNSAERLAGDLVGTVGSPGVNTWDVAVIVNNWLGNPEGSVPYAELNGDTIVNFRDYAIVANDWGKVGDAAYLSRQQQNTYFVNISTIVSNLMSRTSLTSNLKAVPKP